MTDGENKNGRIAVLDIGGTFIKSGIWDGSTECVAEVKETETLAKEGGAAVAGRAVSLLRGYGDFDAIGVSTAGQVNIREGSIHYANPNIPGYTGTPLKQILEQEFHVPAAVENDVNAAALGELHFGAARGVDSFLCLTYGTGVGGAIVVDGKVWHGNNWSGGYFGGILVHPEQRRKNVELSGCYEQYASTTALVQSAMRLDPSLTDGRKIFDAMDRPEVRGIVDGWIDEIVLGLITLICIFDPPLVVLGGGIFAQPYVIREVKERLKEGLEPGFRNVRIERAGLGNTAGMCGAAVLAQRMAARYSAE